MCTSWGKVGREGTKAHPLNFGEIILFKLSFEKSSPFSKIRLFFQPLCASLVPVSDAIYLTITALKNTSGLNN